MYGDLGDGLWHCFNHISHVCWFSRNCCRLNPSFSTHGGPASRKRCRKVAQVLAEESKSEGAATGWLMKRGVHPFNKELDESR